MAGTDWTNHVIRQDGTVHKIGRDIPPPIYHTEDVVSFRFHEDDPEEVLEGLILVVDKNGTIEQDEEPSYDIFRFENRILYKHIRQSLVLERIRRGSYSELEAYHVRYTPRED